MNETPELAEQSGTRALSATVLPLGLSLLLCAIVFVTLGDYGITWDEPSYYSSGLSYIHWFRHPAFSGIDRCWSPTHEHPPLVKLVGGAARAVLAKALGLMDDLRAFRASLLIFVFAAAFGLFKLAEKAGGTRAGVLAVAAFFAMPRPFADAHLAALDYPMAAMWVATACAFWRGLRSLRWMLASSVLLGLALLTKIHAVFLALLLAGWYVAWFRSELGDFLRRRTVEAARAHGRVLCGLLFLLAAPPLLFVLFWPWLWPDPIGRTLQYFHWQKAHVVSPTWYLGKTWPSAPWHYPFVMTAITVPCVILIPALVAMFRWPRGKRAIRLFVLLNFLVPLAAIAFVSPTIQDGVRLFLPAFPFLGLLCALGLQDLWAMVRTWRVARALAVFYAALAVLSIYDAFPRCYPYQNCYYNELVGGIRGAAARGFETEYWGGPYQAILPWVARHSDCRFWVPINVSALKDYYDLGRLRKRAQIGGREDSDYLILLMRQGLFDEELWRFYRSGKPVASVAVEGVPLLAVYRLKGPPGRP